MEDPCRMKDVFWGTETTCLTKKDALIHYLNNRKGHSLSPKKYDEIMAKISTPEGAEAYIEMLEKKKFNPIFFLKAGESNPRLTRIIMDFAW